MFEENDLMHYFNNKVVQKKRAVKSILVFGFFSCSDNLNRYSIYFALNGQILAINGVTRVTAKKLIRAQKNDVLIDFIEVKGINYKLETI